MTLIAEKCLSLHYAPARVAEICGLSPYTIEIACERSDWAGRNHDRFIGRPGAMHGIPAHSNSFQTCRALLRVFLSTIGVSSGHRSNAPLPVKPACDTAPNTPLLGSATRFSHVARGSGYQCPGPATAYRQSLHKWLNDTQQQLNVKLEYFFNAGSEGGEALACIVASGDVVEGYPAKIIVHRASKLSNDDRNGL